MLNNPISLYQPDIVGTPAKMLHSHHHHNHHRYYCEKSLLNPFPPFLLEKILSTAVLHHIVGTFIFRANV
jgi:hypothetical protein